MKNSDSMHHFYLVTEIYFWKMMFPLPFESLYYEYRIWQATSVYLQTLIATIRDVRMFLFAKMKQMITNRAFLYAYRERMYVHLHQTFQQEIHGQ